ncbi:hypothetical protein U062_02245 [Gammaproteobacteria bacterium MOLA455]|nr:hypothetical protein U062_02245 [Gammaproteobacteria bacterium MOLA455]
MAEATIPRFASAPISQVKTGCQWHIGSALCSHFISYIAAIEHKGSVFTVQSCAEIHFLESFLVINRIGIVGQVVNVGEVDVETRGGKTNVSRFTVVRDWFMTAV